MLALQGEGLPGDDVQTPPSPEWTASQEGAEDDGASGDGGATANTGDGSSDIPDNVAPDAPSFADGGTITENSPSGSVVARLETDDPDGDPVTFLIADEDGNAVQDTNFEIVGDEIRVRSGADIDFEDASDHSLYVVATDGTGSSDPALITLNIEDIAEAIRLGDGGETFSDDGITETSVTGGNGDDAITGTDGSDDFTGGAGNDWLSSGTGDDRLTGGDGNDLLSGGAGVDTAVYDGDLSDFAISYDAATQTFIITDLNASDGAEGTDTVTGVETFTFGGTDYSASDLQARAENVAPDGVSFATGGSISETVADGGTIGTAFDPGGQAVGTLETSDSNTGDTHGYTLISDPSGKFEIVGDEVRVRAGEELDFESDASFDITVRTTDPYGETHDQVLTLTVDDFEGSYTASDSGETVTGTSEEDRIEGGLGNDIIHGGAGDDFIDDEFGSGEGAGDDYFSGGAGNDTIWAGDGDDTLVGGEGRRLAGRTGRL